MAKLFLIPLVTTSKNGVMSKADKTKLDSIPENIPTQTEVNNIAANVSALESDMANKQPTLVSGTNIKTINGNSILGEGNLVIEGGSSVDAYTKTESDAKYATKDELTAVETVANNADAKADAATSRIESVETAMGNKQDTLVSGTNIKTVNSQSILGEGNIEVSGVSEEQAQEIAKIPTIETELAQKANVSDVPTVQSGKKGTENNFVYSTGEISSISHTHSVVANLFSYRNYEMMALQICTWGNSNVAKSVVLGAATTTEAGVMTAADKTKLDSISNEWTGTQQEYDALATKEDNIIYYVTE